MNFGGAATTLTMGATSGTASIRNATLRLGTTTNNIITNSGTTNSLTLQPYGNLSLSPTTMFPGFGSSTTLVVTNDPNAAGQVQISGGDLYLGIKLDEEFESYPVNIIFEGATNNVNETTLTVVNPTADRTITFPDASGTVALTSGLVSSLSGSTYISVSGSTGAVTITNTGVQTFNGLTGAVTGVTLGGSNIFTALNTFNAGISASALTVAGGATFSGNVYADNILDAGIGTLSLNDKANTRVVMGDYSANANSTYIYIRDNVSAMNISNPFGNIAIGDPGGVDSGNRILYNAAAGYLDGNGSALTNWTSGSFSQLLTASAGISAAGGVTFAGTLQGTTANFTGLVSSTVGFSGSGTNITGLVSSFNGLTGNVTGVSRVNGFTGGITFAASTGITFTASAGTITLSTTGGGGSKTYAVYTPLDNQPPAANYATIDTRNSIMVLDFDAATDESAVFVGIIPEAASLGSGLKIRINWMATSATSGTCRWGVQIERMNTDEDSDSFDTVATAGSTTNATSGIITTTEITITTIDSVVAGDPFRIKVFRDADGTSGTDDMTGDAELVSVEVRSAA